ncbi:MAG: hypothetical protein QM692_04205 [Thermomicrobiales bacterium]
MDAEEVRADRGAINQAASLPLPNRELREWTIADAEAAGIEAPSLNQVRKQLQRWVNAQLLDEIGVIEPSQGNTNARIAQIRAKVAQIAPNARAETTRIVLRLGQPSELAGGGGEQIERGE